MATGFKSRYIVTLPGVSQGFLFRETGSFSSTSRYFLHLKKHAGKKFYKTKTKYEDGDAVKTPQCPVCKVLTTPGLAIFPTVGLL